MQWPHETEVETPVKNRIDLLISRHFLKDQIDIGVLGSEIEDQLLKAFHERGRAEKSDLYLAQLPSMDPLGARRRKADTFEDIQSFLQEGLPRICQLYASVRPFEEACANLTFERKNLLAQRRLRDAEAICGLAEMEVFGDGDEVT